MRLMIELQEFLKKQKTHDNKNTTFYSSDLNGYRLHIADIGDEVRTRDLEKVFAPYRELEEVWLSNSILCFGFAVYKDKKDAAVAVKACDGVKVCSCHLRVTYARLKIRGQGCRYYLNNMRCHFCRDCSEITAGGSDSRKDHYGRKVRDIMKTRYDLKANTYRFMVGEKVLLYNLKRTKRRLPKLQSSWEGPYNVVTRLNDLAYRI